MNEGRAPVLAAASCNVAVEMPRARVRRSEWGFDGFTHRASRVSTAFLHALPYRITASVSTGQRESELHPPSDWKVVNESIVAWNSADQDMRAPCKLTVSLIRGFCAIHAGEEIVPEVQRQSEVRIPVLRNPRKGHRRKHPFIGIRWSSFSALSYLPLPEVVTVVSPFRDDQPHEPVMGECSAHPELVPCIEDRRG